MTDFEFMLQDRITKIRSMNNLYDLENKAYVSFSGGKDSLVTFYLAHSHPHKGGTHGQGRGKGKRKGLGFFCKGILGV